MAETIRLYLAEVEERLRDRVSDEVLRSILAETEGHLRESASEIESLGFTKVEAEQRAVASFGEAEEYGEALEKVERPRIWAAPASWAVRSAWTATSILLLWPALVRNYPWYHVGETLGAVLPATAPACLVLGAALLGSRASARSFFLVSAVGGALLVPVLSCRFVGSGLLGRYVVRSLQPRSSAETLPADFRIEAEDYRSGLAEFDRYSESAKKGRLPRLISGDGTHYLEPEAAKEIDTDLSPIAIGSWAVENEARDRRGFLGPQAAYVRAFDPSQLVEAGSEAEASAAWGRYAAASRARIVDGIQFFTAMSEKARNRLNEPFLYRLRTMASWGPVFALVWGVMLVAMQGIGTGLRRGFTWLMERTTPGLRPSSGASNWLKPYVDIWPRSRSGSGTRSQTRRFKACSPKQMATSGRARPRSSRSASASMRPSRRRWLTSARLKAMARHWGRSSDQGSGLHPRVG